MMTAVSIALESPLVEPSTSNATVLHWQQSLPPPRHQLPGSSISCLVSVICHWVAWDGCCCSVAATHTALHSLFTQASLFWLCQHWTSQQYCSCFLGTRMPESFGGSSGSSLPGLTIPASPPLEQKNPYEVEAAGMGFPGHHLGTTQAARHPMGRSTPPCHGAPLLALCSCVISSVHPAATGVAGIQTVSSMPSRAGQHITLIWLTGSNKGCWSSRTLWLPLSSWPHPRSS